MAFKLLDAAQRPTGVDVNLTIIWSQVVRAGTVFIDGLAFRRETSDQPTDERDAALCIRSIPAHPQLLTIALVPALAAEIPTLENGGVSQDLTSITWRLKDDLKWSDGTDLTAHDVVFTWQYCVDEATGRTASSSFADITSVEALDNLTVKRSR